MTTVQVDNSSNIRSISHHSQDKLIVEFNTGSRYEYSGVTLQTFREFSEAISKGQYFAANIKGNPSYASRKL